MHSIVPAFFHDQLFLQRRHWRAHYWHNDWGHIDQQCVCCIQVQVHRSTCSSHIEVFENFTGVRLSLSWQYVWLLRPPLVHRSMCGVLCSPGQHRTHTCEQWAVLVSPRPPQWPHTVTSSMQPSLASLDQAQPPDPATSPAPAPGGSWSSSQPLSSRQYQSMCP